MDCDLGFIQIFRNVLLIKFCWHGEILTSDNVGDGDEAHMGEILELDVLEELQKTSDRDSREGVERPVMNHGLQNTWNDQILIFNKSWTPHDFAI